MYQIFFFASTLIYIAIEIMYEWLILIYYKILLREYFILFATFLIINFTSIQTGMFIGLLIAVINFAFHYSKHASESCYLAINRSNILRNVTERYILDQHRGYIVNIQLHGYLFFGTSLSIVEHVKKYVKVWKRVDASTTTATGPAAVKPSQAQPLLPTVRSSSKSSNSTLLKEYGSMDHDHNHSNGNGNGNGSNHNNGTTSRSLLHSGSFRKHVRSKEPVVTYQLESLDGTIYDTVHIPVSQVKDLNYLNIHEKSTTNSLDSSLPFSSPSSSSSSSLSSASPSPSPLAIVCTRFLILDFDNVNGLDATAIRSCFLTLKHISEQYNIVLLFTCLLPEIEKQLRMNEILCTHEHVDMAFPMTTMENSQIHSHRTVASYGHAHTFQETLTELPPCPSTLVFPDIEAALDFSETRLLKEVAFYRFLKHQQQHQHHHHSHPLHAPAPALPHAHTHAHADAHACIEEISPPVELMRQCTGGSKHILSHTSNLADILSDYLRIGTTNPVKINGTNESRVILSTVEGGSPSANPSLMVDAMNHVTNSPATSPWQAAFNSSAPPLYPIPASIKSLLLEMESFFENAIYPEHSILFRPGDAGDRVYVILSGEVSLFLPNHSISDMDVTTSLLTTHQPTHPCSSSTCSSLYTLHTPSLSGYSLALRIRAGCIFGDLHFYLSQPRTLLCMSTSTTCHVYSMSQESWNRMQTVRSDLAALFQQILCKSMSFSITHNFRINIY